MQELITLQISLIKQKTSLVGNWMRDNQLAIRDFKCFRILFARKYLLRSNTPRMAARGPGRCARSREHSHHPFLPIPTLCVIYTKYATGGPEDESSEKLEPTKVVTTFTFLSR